MHLDFVIDGKSLRTWIQEWEGADKPPEEVSLLTPARSNLAVEQIDRLLGRLPHPYWDRGWLLFCGACWDEGCGGVTATSAVRTERSAGRASAGMSPSMRTPTESRTRSTLCSTKPSTNASC